MPEQPLIPIIHSNKELEEERDKDRDTQVEVSTSKSKSNLEASPVLPTIPLKKKPKGRVFQCTGYPNCSMTFTRSEHLARHIRKHTGERPFKCEYCSKKFSRLDNLRQHKQTVHVYENFVLTYPGEKFSTRIKNIKKNSNHNNKSNKIQIDKVQFEKSQNNYQVNVQEKNLLNLHQRMINGQQPITPTMNLNLNYSSNKISTLLSPPNSASPHNLNQQNTSMLPPPRGNNFIRTQGYSELRPSLANKPLPILVPNLTGSGNNIGSNSMNSMNSNNSSTPQNYITDRNSLITPSSGTILDIGNNNNDNNSIIPLMYSQMYLNQQNNSSLHPDHLFGPASNFSSPAASPSLIGFPNSISHPNSNSNSPYSMTFNNSMASIITPTTQHFDTQNNNPYLSPLYYQRLSRPITSQAQSQVQPQSQSQLQPQLQQPSQSQSQPQSLSQTQSILQSQLSPKSQFKQFQSFKNLPPPPTSVSDSFSNPLLNDIEGADQKPNKVGDEHGEENHTRNENQNENENENGNEIEHENEKENENENGKERKNDKDSDNYNNNYNNNDNDNNNNNDNSSGNNNNIDNENLNKKSVINEDKNTSTQVGKKSWLSNLLNNGD